MNVRGNGSDEHRIQTVPKRAPDVTVPETGARYLVNLSTASQRRSGQGASGAKLRDLSRGKRFHGNQSAFDIGNRDSRF